MKRPSSTKGIISFIIASGAAIRFLGSRILRRQRRMNFSGKSVIITGGSHGLGLEISRIFARKGARLTLLARDPDELQRARRELIALGGYVQVRVCNVADKKEVEQAVNSVVQERGRIDVLVNNAGVSRVGPFDNQDPADFEEVFDVHVRGPLYLIKAVLPQMKHQGSGRIVNISSIGGLVAIPHLVPYSSSKFALTGLSDGVRAELAQYGILVTTVSPGLMRTGSFRNAVFKGRRAKELKWFAISSSLPFFSINPEKAARQIVNACQYGDSHLIITVQARMLHIMNTLFPGMTASAMKFVSRVLPKPSASADNMRKRREKTAPAAPSIVAAVPDQTVEEHKERKIA